MCCKLGFWVSQRWQFASGPYQRCKFLGLGRVSYVDLMRKLSLACGILHVGPRYGSVVTSETTSSFLSFFEALDHSLGAGPHPSPDLPGCSHPTIS
ncbi:hypothetical protein SKAU_G00092910 [Synaphobranchus kaupii]|uniref:Uncharacterized protein n=1 Tax=Synaphobranchus kaupii TaxID=118154 RepID=A0A9Q1FWW1_SYNKA|nr:hypothetical protein SKAU_G00092910 [Synaphobranchus kaupii]